jgi:hypothetical protein
MKRSSLVALFALALVCCRSQDRSEYGVASEQFPDMVVPEHFRIQDEHHQSYSTEEAGWRHGHFVYTGPAHVDEACAYLLQRMPQHQWTLEADNKPDETTRTLRFSRGRYVTDYVVSRQEGRTQMVVDYRTVIERPTTEGR